MDGELDPRHTVGRIFGNDWTIANVAKLLRFNAGQSHLRPGPLTGGLREMNQDYIRKTSARHLPSGVAVSFQREQAGGWLAELCFTDLEHYLPWNQALAEQWLAALFLQDRALVAESTDTAEAGACRRFHLPVSR